MLAEDYASCSWNDRLNRDRNWLLLSGYSQLRLIQKTDVDLYHDLLNYHYIFSPLVRGAIDLKTRYTFGLSFSIQSEITQNENRIKEIMNDPRNKVAFFDSQALFEADHELQKGGNIYVAVWRNTKPVQIRV